MKRCARCTEHLDESNFKIRKRTGRPDRLSSYCIKCENGYHKQFYHDNKPVYLYVIDYVPLDYCKIGITQNLDNRLKDIRNVWPEAVYAALYDARCPSDVEQGILKLLSNVRIATSEVLKINASAVITIIDASSTAFGCTKLPKLPKI